MSVDGSRQSSKEVDDPFDDWGSKPGTASKTQDVFELTGTTFAGATDMNSTAGPSDTRPSTGYDTRPMTSLAIPTIGQGGDEGSASPTARHNRLLVEAELRAEHQAAARTTMLDLAHALDGSNNRARELATLLRDEYDNSAALRSERDELQIEVDAMIEKEEKRQADILIEKALASGNKVFFNMLLEKSKDAYDFSTFVVKDAAGKPVPPPPKPEGGIASMTDAFSGSVGDKVTLSWCVKLWRREVTLTKATLEKVRLEQEEIRRKEEEARKIEEAKQRAVEEVRKMVRDLEAQTERARQLLEEQRQKQETLERELNQLKEAAAKVSGAAQAREDALKAELESTKNELLSTKTSLANLQVEFEASQQALRKADEAFAAERASLQAVIRQVSSELHEAIVLAKHMRETALKAKRDASGSVSPSKFAELIAQLEEMKSQLSVLARDAMHEKDTNSWLYRQLDKNKRQLELERQFLPLVRKVRGPIGPKVKGDAQDGPKKLKDATQLAASAPQASIPALPSSPTKRSQSMGNLAAAGGIPRAMSAGGPLPGGSRPGSRGFEDDQTRFASSMGFESSNGRGTPLRG